VKYLHALGRLTYVYLEEVLESSRYVLGSDDTDDTIFLVDIKGKRDVN
jgi:hypothetical protein